MIQERTDGLSGERILASIALRGGGDLAQRLKALVTVRGVLLALAVGAACWVSAGWRLRGWSLLAWQLVPLLGIAGALCIVAPGHLIAKQPIEGPSVIELNARDAVTVLDITGIALAALAVLLAFALLPLRHYPRALARWAVPLLLAGVLGVLIIAAATGILWARFAPDPPVRRRGHEGAPLSVAMAQSSTCFHVLRYTID